MDEIEHLQTDGVRIGILIWQADVFQRSVLHTDGLVHQHLPVFSVQRYDGPGISFGRSDAGRNLLAFQIPGDEDPLGIGRQRTVPGLDAENAEGLIGRHPCAVFLLGRNRHIQQIRSVSGKFQGQRLARRRFTTGKDNFTVGRSKLIAQRQRGIVSSIIHRAQHQIKNPGGYYIIIRDRLIRSYKLGIGLILHLHVNPQPVTDKPALKIVVGFSRRLRHRNLSFVISGIPCIEYSLERVSLQRDVFVQYLLTAPSHLNMHARARESVSGIADELAAHGHVVTFQIQFIKGIKFQVEGRKYKLVHDEKVGAKFFDFQCPVTTATARRNHKLAGHGAPVIRLQLQRFNNLPFIITQTDLYLASFHHLQAAGRVAVKDNGLEL